MPFLSPYLCPCGRTNVSHWVKVVVFDSSIPVQLAFYALVEHGETTPLAPIKGKERSRDVVALCEWTKIVCWCTL